MLYYLIKLPLRIANSIFFRKLYISHRERLPKDVPFVLAVNHPTAFLDPILIAVHIVPTVHFMLRGDVFSSPVIRFLLDQIKTIPIFRARDGFSKLKNNQGTMDLVYAKINEGQNILILAEGQTKHEKKMRPIQKGAARMLFGTYDKFGRKDMVVIPVGVNYTDSNKFRSNVMIDFGEPIPMSTYLPQYETDSRKAITELTKTISEGMRERIIHVEDSTREKVASLLMEIFRNNNFEKVLPILSENISPLNGEYKIAESINKMNQNAFSSLQEVTKEYEGLLTALALEDKDIAQPHQSNWKNTITLLVGLIPFIIGYGLNALPFWIAKWIANKKVRKIEFNSSVKFGAAFVLYPLYFLGLAFLLSSLGWHWWMILLIPFLGWFALFWRDFFCDWNGTRIFQALPTSTQDEIQELRNKLADHLP